MKITRRQLRRLIQEASMFSPYAAKGAAKERAAQNLSPRGKHNLDVMLGDIKRDEDEEEEEPDEETLIQGHELLDTTGDYESPFVYKDDVTGDFIKSSYQDIQHFDKDMQDAMLKHRRMQMADEFEEYMAAEGPEMMSTLYKVADAPGVDLYVTTVDDKANYQAPGSEVARNPEGFYLMAIATDTNDFVNEVGNYLGIDFDHDEQDAIAMLLEKMAGDRPMGHVPEGYQFSPEHAFIAWITQNNPNLKIYVDP